MTANTDLITNKALEIINQIQSGVMAHGGDAVNLALATVRISAIGALIEGFIMLVIGVICVIMMAKIISSDRFDKESPGWIFWTVLVTTAFCFMGALVDLFNIWTYVALYDQKLYLTHEIIQKVVR